MSGYFGYTNSYGYGQSANTYPPGYVAQQYVRSYESYQSNPAAAAAAAAAYNYNAYRAMPPPPPPPNQQAKYDYSTMTQGDATKSYYYPNTNGYDAAVYSAASSIMQQQTQAAPKWPTATAPGANPLAKQKNVFKRRNPTQSTQLFYCDVCKISCAGPQTYKEHLEGQKHKKREQAAKSSQSTPQTPAAPSSRSQNIIRCELCDVSCTGRDAYAAHLRGTKHQKTIKLHQKLGKPIPPDVPLTPVNAPKPGTTGTQPGIVTISAPPVINPAATAVTQKPKVVTPQKVNFVGGSVLKTLTEEKTTNESSEGTIPKLFDMNTSAASGENSQDSMDQIDQEVEPVGREYIEMIPEGKIITFHCKLCDCKFNDPNAKDMHLKGRRHRLAYKKKVDPSLRVDLKNLRKNAVKARRDKQKEKLKAKHEERIRNHMNEKFMQAITMQGGKRGDSHDDRHIIQKHLAIHPCSEELGTIQELVTSCEKALKLVSDEIAEQDAANNIEMESSESQIQPQPQQQQQPIQVQETAMDVGKTNDDSQDQQQKDSDDNQTYRALKGVMRVGLLAKSLLLKGDSDVQLVVLCSEKPTRMLFNRVYDLLTAKLESVSQIKYTTFKDAEKECLCVRTNVEPLITCRIFLTSPACREENVQQDEAMKIEPSSSDTTTSTTMFNQYIQNLKQEKEEPSDLLDKQKCLESLAALRHAKWFQARASGLPNCVVIIRILRDLCKRNPTWHPLSQWALELLVEKSLSSSNQPLSPGEALRRVLECLSSGILLPNGPGLYDPCEKIATDAAENLKNQQREEITSSSQMALRLLAFKQIHKILGMDVIVNRNPRKRQRDNSENDNECDEKKEKKEETTTLTPGALPTTLTPGTAPTTATLPNTPTSSIPSLLSAKPIPSLLATPIPPPSTLLSNK